MTIGELKALLGNIDFSIQHPETIHSAFEGILGPFADFSEATRALRTFSDSVQTDFPETIRMLGVLTESVRNDLDAIGDFSALSSVTELSKIIQANIEGLRIAGISDLIDASSVILGQGSIVDDGGSFQGHGRVLDQAIFEEAVREYFPSDVERAEIRRDTTVSSRSNTIELVIAILVLVFQILSYKEQLQSGREGKRVREHDALFRQHVIESLESLERNTQKLSQVPQYVVLRSARLRSQPTTKSRHITTLRPNQIVRGVASQEKWLQVVYFDYEENMLRFGWVYKPLLAELIDGF